jgi:hypothetical protein
MKGYKSTRTRSLVNEDWENGMKWRFRRKR